MRARLPSIESASSSQPSADTATNVALPDNPNTGISIRVPQRGFHPRRAVGVWAERFVLLVLIAGFSVKAFLPAWRHLNSDFPNYYLIARLYHVGYPLERVYDWTWLQRQKDHEGIERNHVSFIPSTLASALTVLPWSSLPPLQAKHRWLLANLVFLSLTYFLLVCMTRLGWTRIAVLMFLAFVPLRENFLLGQMHVLVLLLVTLGAWLFLRESLVLSGISLAVAAALKIYPALFLIFFLWKRKWRAVIGLIAGLLSVASVSLSLFGRDACLLYVRQVLPAGLRGETIDPYNTAWNSWTALLRRLLIAEPELNPFPVVHLPWLYALLHPLLHSFILVVFLWAIGWRAGRGHTKEDRKLEWAAFLFLLLFLSSQPGSYHFVALIPAAVLIVDVLVSRGRTVQAGIAVVAYALVCAPVIHLPGVSPIGWGNLLYFSRLAYMAASGMLFLWTLLPRDSEAFKERFNFRSFAVASVVVIALTATGFVLTSRHLHGQFENYQHRVTIANDLFASDPVVNSDGVLFVGMTSEGYTVRRLQSGTVVDVPKTAGDLFHPTAAAEAVWAEHTSQQGSQVVQLQMANPSQALGNEIEAANAQEPAASRDGHFLSFLREIRGRNSLWIKATGKTTNGSVAREEREIAGEEYDVREVSWLDGQRLIFSSRSKGKFFLYAATLQGKVEKLSKPSCSARYPAVAPNGRWLAFSCDEGGSWQLHAMDLEGTQELQVTRADCNSIAPAWFADSKRIVYATDCGRGLGLTALAEVTVLH